MPRKKKVEEPIASAEEPVQQPATEEPALEAVIEDLEDVEQGEACLEQAVTFQLDGQLYALPIDVVQEIQQLVEFTPLPDISPYLLGLIDVRGMVVPAIDLRVLVGLERRPFSLETPMIFCRVRGHVVCLVVDEVEDVVDLPAAGLQPPSALYGLADRLIGTCRLPIGLVLLLDIDRLVPEAALAAADASAGGR